MKEVVEGGTSVKGSNMEFAYIHTYIDAKLHYWLTFTSGIMLHTSMPQHLYLSYVCVTDRN